MAALLAASEKMAQAAALELAVIVHPSRAGQNVAAVDLDAIFRMLRRNWPDGAVILPFNCAIGDASRTIFDAAVLRMSPEQSAQYWLDQRIRSGLRPPRAVSDARMIRRLVATMANAIGYVPADGDFTEVRVVCRIRGGAVVNA